ncbi:hypothetical protein [Methylotenera sp.]|uniref:hypothetical protein n=1 Tax=Methylotenera sp. TaxID=2051956 RepID=UPI00248736FE|nr:hypothetical protein [Methylotenera sp.]MDI1362511.1 hypothetical protein [Methylotenera sp.]
MDIFASFATDEKLEVEGTWVPLGGTAKILVARAGNKKYGRLLSAAVDKNKLALDAKTDEADALSDSIMVDVLANSVLLGWEGLSFKGTEALPYNLENAKTLLAVKDFRALVSEKARNIDNFRATAEEATAKK